MLLNQTTFLLFYHSDGFASNNLSWQDMSWTKYYSILRGHMTPLGHNELNRISPSMEHNC